MDMLRNNNLPQNWKTVKFGEVCEVIGGYAFDSKKMKDQGTYQIIKMGNIYQGVLDLKRVESFVNEINAKEEKYILLNNDVIMTLTGTVGKRDYGYSVIIRNNDKKLLCNQRLALLRSQDIEPYFLFLQINEKYFLTSFFDVSKGGTGNQTNVSINALRNLQLHFPPLPEQTRIANCLSKWDEGIETLKKLIAAKKKLKKGLMQRLLSPENPLAGFENIEWRVVKLGEACNVIMGQSPSSLNYNSDGIGLPLIQGNADISNNRTISRIYTTEITKISKKGYIILTVRAPVGEIAYVIQDEVCIGRGVSSINGINSINEFIFFYLIHNAKKWQELEQGSTFSAINRDDIENFQIHLPPLSKQQKIAQILSKADEEIELLQKKLANLQLQKSGLMQVLLSGKIRFSEFKTSLLAEEVDQKSGEGLKNIIT